MDLQLKVLTHEGIEIALSKKEMQILEHFMRHQDKVFSKKDLLEILWKDSSVDENNIDTHMFNIRRKLPQNAPRIDTLKGVGFILKSKL